jgi:DegV family protein with EDD domain
MNEYVIVSDATLDLPASIIDEFGIKVIPMGFNIDTAEYFHYPDEREIPITEFYGKLKSGSVSHTTQITPIVFADFLSDILKQGKDVIYIAFSSGLSGTFNTSQIVLRDLKEEYPDRKIYCIDSLCASIGEGLLVYNAAVQKKNGISTVSTRDNQLYLQ